MDNTAISVDVTMSAVPTPLRTVRWPPVACTVLFIPWPAPTEQKQTQHMQYNNTRYACTAGSTNLHHAATVRAHIEWTTVFHSQAL